MAHGLVGGDSIEKELLMDQANQGNYSASVADASLKRKRGRPKRQHSQNPALVASASPGFEERKLKTARQVEANKKACEVMVGKAVSGVVDAAFDGGYLLSVKVGNSDISLRGVVFKPGHYVPVSGENDVVPNVQMINRFEISQHAGNQIQMNSCMPRSKRKYRKRVTRQTNGFSSLSESQTADQSSHVVTSEGMLSPIELVSRSVGLSNGIPPASDLAYLKSKQDNHTHHQSRPIDTQKQGGSNCDVVAKTTDAPFQTLLGEVMKRAQSPGHMPEARMENSESSDKLFAEDSGINFEAQHFYANEPLSVEPLQAVQPVHDHSAFLDNPLGKGKLTELLQAMQNNRMHHSPQDH